MEFVKKEGLQKIVQRARVNWRAYGENAAVEDTMSVGYCRFSLAEGEMLPHKHEREIMYVVDVKGATARFGSGPDSIESSQRLEKGMLMRASEGEWHVFEMDDENSFLEIIWIFDVPQNHVTEAQDRE